VAPAPPAPCAAEDGYLDGRGCYARPVVAGGIIIAVVMLLLLPVAVMLGGAIWSALLGWFLVDDADHRAAPEQSGGA
jgi:hypothetical protein